MAAIFKCVTDQHRSHGEETEQRQWIQQPHQPSQDFEATQLAAGPLHNPFLARAHQGLQLIHELRHVFELEIY